MSTTNIKKVFVIGQDVEEMERPQKKLPVAFLNVVIFICLTIVIGLSIYILWVYLIEPKYNQWKKKLMEKYKPKENFEFIGEPLKFDIPLTQPIPTLSPISFSPVEAKPRLVPKDSPKGDAGKQGEKASDILKVGIYTKKEAKREYSWFSNIENMEVAIPNMTKLLKASKDKSAATYIEKELIRDGKTLVQGISQFNIPKQVVKSAKIVAFSLKKLMIPFSLNGEYKFGLIVPVSSDLKLRVESDDETPLEEVAELDEPKLFRTNGNITIEQTEDSAKQFLIFCLQDPLLIQDLIPITIW